LRRGASTGPERCGSRLLANHRTLTHLQSYHIHSRGRLLRHILHPCARLLDPLPSGQVGSAHWHQGGPRHSRAGIVTTTHRGGSIEFSMSSSWDPASFCLESPGAWWASPSPFEGSNPTNTGGSYLSKLSGGCTRISPAPSAAMATACTRSQEPGYHHVTDVSMTPSSTLPPRLDRDKEVGIDIYHPVLLRPRSERAHPFLVPPPGLAWCYVRHLPGTFVSTP
jgi:hypothetical protein